MNLSSGPSYGMWPGFYCLSPDTEIGSWVAKRIKYLELYQEVKSAMSKSTTCRSCGELIPTKLEDYLGVVPNIKDPVEIFCDNEGAVALTKEPHIHERSRHILRKYHYVRKRVEAGGVVVKRVSSEENPADPLTKALSRIKHDDHTRFIGIRDASGMF